MTISFNMPNNSAHSIPDPSVKTTNGKDINEQISDVLLKPLRLISGKEVKVTQEKAQATTTTFTPQKQLNLAARVGLGVLVALTFPVSLGMTLIGLALANKSKTYQEKMDLFEKHNTQDVKQVEVTYVKNAAASTGDTRKNFDELPEHCLALETPGRGNVGKILLQVPSIDKVSPGLQLTEETLGDVFEVCNKYTTDTPYFVGSPHQMRVDIETRMAGLQTVNIHRYNHNGTHSARQVRGLEGVLDLIEAKADPGKKAILESLTPEQKANLKLGAYFLRAGRVDEGRYNDGDDYSSRSALIYEAYAKQLGISDDEISRMKRLIIDSCKPIALCSQETQTNPQDKLCYELLSLTHVMDLIRVCNPSDFKAGGWYFNEIETRTNEILVDGPHVKQTDNAKELLAFAAKLCEATGIIPYSSNTRTTPTKAQLFHDCSRKGKYCWDTLQDVQSPWESSKKIEEAALKKQKLWAALEASFEEHTD